MQISAGGYLPIKLPPIEKRRLTFLPAAVSPVLNFHLLNLLKKEHQLSESHKNVTASRIVTRTFFKNGVARINRPKIVDPFFRVGLAE
jgi:hypothetical protein